MKFPSFKSHKRIRRQTIALTKKNFLVFYKSPVTTIIRALLFPLLVALVLSYLKTILSHVTFYSYPTGFANSTRPIKDLSDAIGTNEKLVFVRNGFPSKDVDPVINGILGQKGMNTKRSSIVDDANDLFDECPQTLAGASDCFAAVIFTTWNATNVEYSIAVNSIYDDQERQNIDYKDHRSLSTDRLLPLQWAIDSHIGNFSTAPAPNEIPWIGYLIDLNEDPELLSGNSGIDSHAWFTTISRFVAPIFVIILMGVVFHLSLSVAGERQSGVSELLAAQTCTTVPRILSNLISFILLYLPGWIFCSVVITQVLFTRTSDILLIFLTILAGTALTTASHLVASFFRKGQLAGLYTSTLMFALALVTIAFSLSSVPNFLAIQVLTFLFTPITYATLISDIARAENINQGYSLATNQTLQITMKQAMDPDYPEFGGYRYIIIFVVQILLFTLATYGVEQWLWGVKRTFKPLQAGNDVTLRATHLSKTFNGRRRWYWPFQIISGSVVRAVDDFNIELKKGSVNFLLGPNGGGKTTILKCIAGMHSMDPESSLEISEDGLPFGVCPQLNVFWGNLNVAEHITIWRNIKSAALDEKIEDDEDVLVECDLIDKKLAAAKTLSGGQQRKLQLAIAFVGGSKMCCVDEASSGLDPLSRRNIWNIISRGHTRRTVLMTTHFLDEADILADYISILYKGKMVCSGTSTALKASHGDAYTIREIQNEDGEGEAGTVWSTHTSADATKKVLELEEISDASFSVQFPTLDQVFLKATDSTTHALHEGGDGVVGEIDMPKELEEVESIHHEDLNLDIGHTIGFFRQIYVILSKRYVLIRHNWISFGIALIIPIIVSAALTKFISRFDPLVSCRQQYDNVHNISSTDFGYSSSGSWVPFAPLDNGGYSGYVAYQSDNTTVVGPPAAFSGPQQNDIFFKSVDKLFNVSDTLGYYPNYVTNARNESFATRGNVSSFDGMLDFLKGSSENPAFGIFSPTPEKAVLVHHVGEGFSQYDETMTGLSVITNRIANSTAANGQAKIVQADYRQFRVANPKHDFRALPLVILLLLALITSTSIAIIYPTDERINNVRALQYSNGVSPAALWIAYLIFDMQVMIVSAIVMYACIFVGSAASIWFDPSYIFGVMILFGIATYLGLYVLSLFIKKAAFAIAAAVHMVLFVLYFAGYIINDSDGPALHKYDIYNQLQYGLGLSSPAANLARAMFIGIDSYDITCGRSGLVTPKPGSFNLYSGAYVNLIVQIIFLICILGLAEYGSTEWFYRLFFKKRVPARLRYVVDSGDTAQNQHQIEQEKTVQSNLTPGGVFPILIVDRVSKFFGNVFATENVSFNIAQDEVLALIGPNGAGKTSMINMIRGILKPNFGDIHLDGVSVLSAPAKARIHMGVCPQDDAIDELNVRQTLNFYAAVKGLKDVRSNVDTILEAFKITQFENVSVKKLSGGTRRKLMVSIALLGNPRVLLLDEPSTGQDAGAKRVLWKVLQGLRTHRAILLTTHSMEETEALATKVTILATRVLASGSLSHLRNEYGGQYRVRATYGPQQSEADITRVLQDQFGEKMSALVVRYGEAWFELPHNTRELGHIMQKMEGMRIGGEIAVGGDGSLPAEAGGAAHGAAGPDSAASAGGRVAEGTGRNRGRVFSGYVILEPTMEEVFMKVCERASLIAPVG